MGAATKPQPSPPLPLPPLPPPLSAPQEIFAGCIAGVADALACHPVDVIKTQAWADTSILPKPNAWRHSVEARRSPTLFPHTVRE
jgi:hypothetical protein